MCPCTIDRKDANVFLSPLQCSLLFNYFYCFVSFPAILPPLLCLSSTLPSSASFCCFFLSAPFSSPKFSSLSSSIMYLLILRLLPPPCLPLCLLPPLLSFSLAPVFLCSPLFLSHLSLISRLLPISFSLRLRLSSLFSRALIPVALSLPPSHFSLAHFHLALHNSVISIF